MSSGSPIRPSVVDRSIWVRSSSLVSTMSSAEVATDPTAIALTRILGARSAAASRVYCAKAAFAVPYAR